MLRSPLALAIGLAACAASAPHADLPPLDATWVCSWYVLREGSFDCALEALTELLDCGAVEVIGSCEAEAGYHHGPMMRTVVLLAGKPEALAQAHFRLCEARPALFWGCALRMARRPRGHDTVNDDRPSNLYILREGDWAKIGEVLERLVVERNDVVLSRCRPFFLGRSRQSERDLVVVDAPWDVLDRITATLREKGVQVSGFLFCEIFPLPVSNWRWVNGKLTPEDG
jgi:hypothetical protein